MLGGLHYHEIEHDAGYRVKFFTCLRIVNLFHLEENLFVQRLPD